MKCPHCLIEVNADFEEMGLNTMHNNKRLAVQTMSCPNPTCRKAIVLLCMYELSGGSWNITDQMQIFPQGSSRPLCPVEVIDKDIAEDYNEACFVLPISTKASAALSRRCLQNLLLTKANVKKGDLSHQIDEVISNGGLPSHLSDSIDAIRNIGNFAGHPLKSTSSGEIVSVEIGEAEWVLDVLESLFDFYYIQPNKIAEKRKLLNAKLAELGKPLMK